MPCPTPGDGEKTRRSKWTPLLPNTQAPWGWGGKLPYYFYLFLYIFYSYYPLIPGGTWHQFSFRPRAAPELYGSPELGVRGSPVLEA